MTKWGRDKTPCCEAHHLELNAISAGNRVYKNWRDIACEEYLIFLKFLRLFRPQFYNDNFYDKKNYSYNKILRF